LEEQKRRALKNKEKWQPAVYKELIANDNTPFETLLEMISKGNFFSTYWQNRSCHIKAPEKIENEQTLQQLMAILETNELGPRDCRLVEKGELAAFYSFAKQSKACAQQVKARIEQGATFVFRYFNRFDNRVEARIDKLKSALNERLLSSTRSNCYYTPPHSSGFAPHWDCHDIVVYQASGSKVWSLWNSPIELPNKHQNFSHYEYQPSGEIQLTLNAGDVLFLPRGCVHNARTEDNASVHYSFGIRSIDYGDMLLEMARELIFQNPQFRQSVDFGNPNHIEEIKKMFAQQVSAQSAVPSLATASLNLITPPTAKASSDITITLDSNLKRTGVTAHVINEKGNFTLFTEKGAIAIPAKLKVIIEEINKTDNFSPSKLKMPPQASILFCEKLIEAELFTVQD